MAIPLLALAAAGAVAGGMKHAHEKKRQSQSTNERAEYVRMSPWLKMDSSAFPQIERAGSLAGNLTTGAFGMMGAGQGTGATGGAAPDAGGGLAPQDSMNFQPQLMGATPQVQPTIGSNWNFGQDTQSAYMAPTGGSSWFAGNVPKRRGY